MWVPLVVIGVGVFGILVATAYAVIVLREETGSERMEHVSRLIQRGAMTFVSREYRYVAVCLVVMVPLLWLTLKNGWMIAVCYLFGAAIALFAGFAGLWMATRTNVRATAAARTSVFDALQVAFRGGSVIGLAVTSLGLIGVAVCFLLFESVFDLPNSASTVLGFALGAATVALFLRVGGGIFTKGADVGADLVGKVEEGIPEDDPRNPAVIADNVGDNVGDVAGMGSDLNASFIAAMAAPIVVASSSEVQAALGDNAMLLPLVVGAAGVAASILGTLVVRRSGRVPGRSLMMAFAATATIATIAYFLLAWAFLGWSHIGLFIPLLIGITCGIGLGLVSAYFTSSSFGPVKRIGKAAESGAGVAVIAGLSEGLLSTAGAAVLFGVASAVAYYTCRGLFPGSGFYAVSLTGIGMLSISGIIVACDSFGCIADNAGGIAEMSGVEEEVRDRTDILDAIGNTTAAISKGFAIGAATLVSFSLLSAYSNQSHWLHVRLVDENSVLGLVLGGMVPLAFSALSMTAVQRAAITVVEEVRRQFHDIAGLREGVEGVEPDYTSIIDLSTRQAIHSMLVPALFVFALPLGTGLLLGLDSLAGFIMGVIVVGFLTGFWMSNAGGAWDNAKKFIEGGHHGGKGSFAHASAVVGDTVGDPLKDTAGPAMNIVMKVTALMALIFIPLFH